MNRNLEVLSFERGANVLSAFTGMTEGRSDASSDNGLHVVDSIADQRANVIWNLRCNGKLDRLLGAPFNRTCCSPYPRFSWVQIVFVAVVAVLLPYKALRRLQKHRRPGFLKVFCKLDASTIFMATIGYCVLADRTHVLNKTAKHFEMTELNLL